MGAVSGHTKLRESLQTNYKSPAYAYMLVRMNKSAHFTQTLRVVNPIMYVLIRKGLTGEVRLQGKTWVSET